MIGQNYPTNISKKRIFLLSVPIFFANLAIPFTGIVDTGLMGNLGETRFLAATSIATSIMTMIIWSFGFLRMGTVGIVAQLFGKSDYREIAKTLLRNFFIAIIIGVVIILFKTIIVNSTKYFFSTSIDTQELINTYISIRVLSVPAELITYILVGFYLGIQKTKISSLLVITMSILNIVLSSFFVLSLNLSVFGVALGTLISSYITAVIFSLYTYNFIVKKFQVIPTFQKLIVPSKLIKLLTINFDIFIRTLLLTFSFLWVTYMGSKLGEDYLAINTILMQFIILAAFFLDAYAFSTEGIVGFTIGRKAKKSFLQTVSNSFKLSFFTGIIISIFYLFLFKTIVNLITDLDYIRFLTYGFVFWIILIPPVASFCYQLDGIFIGATQSSEIRDSMILSVILFIFFSIYLTQNLGNHGLWLALTFFMIVRSLTLNFYFTKILKKF